MFLRVTEFHRIFNQHISTVPALPGIKERGLRMRLLIEELDEFCKAYSEDDLVEMADGLGDICYIIAGTCVSYGICPEDALESPYEMLGQLTVFYNLQLDRILREDFAAYMEAEIHDDLNDIKHCLMRMMMTVFGVALHLGIPLNTVFAEVHRSNLAKVDETGVPKYREDGKLLKPAGWQPPDIKSILERVNRVVKTD